MVAEANVACVAKIKMLFDQMEQILFPKFWFLFDLYAKTFSVPAGN